MKQKIADLYDAYMNVLYARNKTALAPLQKYFKQIDLSRYEGLQDYLIDVAAIRESFLWCSSVYTDLKNSKQNAVLFRRYSLDFR